jgi:hypothetical protein
MYVYIPPPVGIIKYVRGNILPHAKAFLLGKRLHQVKPWPQAARGSRDSAFQATPRGHSFTIQRQILLPASGQLKLVQVRGWVVIVGHRRGLVPRYRLVVDPTFQTRVVFPPSLLPSFPENLGGHCYAHAGPPTPRHSPTAA